uniref:Uncharacterized protein n=1 Tax=Anguilla anguilla TaxID=7936 RepID=A0A0E9REF2_ANGAN
MKCLMAPVNKVVAELSFPLYDNVSVMITICFMKDSNLTMCNMLYQNRP